MRRGARICTRTLIASGTENGVALIDLDDNGRILAERSRSTLLFLHQAAELYGSDITLLNLISGLDRERFHPIVVVPCTGPLVSQLHRLGAEVIVRTELPVLRRKYMNAKGLVHLSISSFREARWLIDVVRRRDVALVHCNTLAVLIPGLITSLARRPQVWHVHEIMSASGIIARLLTTLSSAASTVIVANSQITADSYCRSRLADLAPVKVILNGVSESHVCNGSRAPLRRLVGAGANDVVLSIIGRINGWKGHSIFIDAAEQLATEFKNVYFLVVGDSYFGEEWKTEAIDRRIESSEILRGRIARLPHTAKVGSVYAASDVIVVPSTRPEPFGLVAVEAMAAGLPVIASRAAGFLEIVEDRRTGLLVNPCDPASLMMAMKELATSPAKRASMGLRGRERFKSCFRVQRYVAEFTRLYDEILKEG